jgi:hypothetical protein
MHRLGHTLTPLPGIEIGGGGKTTAERRARPLASSYESFSSTVLEISEGA